MKTNHSTSDAFSFPWTTSLVFVYFNVSWDVVIVCAAEIENKQPFQMKMQRCV